MTIMELARLPPHVVRHVGSVAYITKQLIAGGSDRQRLFLIGPAESNLLLLETIQDEYQFQSEIEINASTGESYQVINGLRVACLDVPEKRLNQFKRGATAAALSAGLPAYQYYFADFEPADRVDIVLLEPASQKFAPDVTEAAFFGWMQRAGWRLEDGEDDDFDVSGLARLLGVGDQIERAGCYCRPAQAVASFLDGLIASGWRHKRLIKMSKVDA